VLDRLTKHGLVLAEPANHGFVYRLNRDHLLAPAVFAGFEARVQLFRKLGEACANPLLGGVSAAVFGSVARRESTAESDIDLVLVIHDDVDTTLDQWIDARDDLVDQVRRWTGNSLELITVAVDHLQNLATSAEPIVAAWREEARTIFGVELASLVTGTRGS